MSEAPKPTPPLQGTPGHLPDLTTRFAMAIFLTALACVAIWWGGWPFRILILIGAGIMLAEWAEMHRVAWLWIWVGVALLAGLLLGGMEYFYPMGAEDTVSLGYGQELWSVYFETFVPFLTLCGIAAGAALLLALVSRRPTLGWGFLYIGIPALALLTLSWISTALVFWVMFVTWATDSGAFFAGKAIGGPKLAPSISPAKTWAGLFGGAVAAGLMGWLVAWWLQIDTGPSETGEPDWIYQSFLFLGAPMSIVAQMGDLYESWVKRRCGVKDSGTILPGHGGALDRCDGLIAVALATLLYLMAGLWFD